MRGSRKFCQSPTLPTIIFLILFILLVDEGREDPNTTKGRHHRPTGVPMMAQR